MNSFCFVLLLSFSLFVCTQTATISWKTFSKSGSFHDPANWDLGRVPTSTDDVMINATGIYYVLINQTTTVKTLSLNKGGRCGCNLATQKSDCLINLIVQAPLTVTAGLSAYRWTNVYVVNTTITGSAYFGGAGLYGSGVITGDVQGSSFAFNPHTLKAVTTAVRPVTQNNLGKFTFGGKLNISSALFIFDIQGNQPVTTMDAVYVNGGIYGVTSSTVSLLFDGTFPSPQVTYQIFFSPIISAKFDMTSNSVTGPYTPPTQVCGASSTSGRPADYSDGESTTSTQNYNCPSDGYGFLLAAQTTCCPTGWTGTSCNIPICPGEPDCSNQGTCNSDDVIAPPFCECDTGFTGTSCAITTVCSKFDYCSNHGSCDTTALKCVCNSGWTGANCSVPLCPGTPQCSNNGVCNTITGTPICDCKPGYSGTQCNELIKQVGECNLNCSGHGTCNNGTCECVGDWTGSGCQIAVCSGTETNCNGVGTCVPFNETVNQCECLPGWSGKSCTVTTCPSDCSGRGECVVTGSTVKCDCSYPYFGDDCASDEIKLNSDNSSKENVPIGLVAGLTGGILGLAIVSSVVGFVLLKRKQEKRRAALRKITNTNEEASRN